MAPGFEDWRGSVKILRIRTGTKWLGITAFLCSSSYHRLPPRKPARSRLDFNRSNALLFVVETKDTQAVV